MSAAITITEKLNEAAKLINGRPWGAEIGRPRIYLPGFNKRDQVYIEFPDADETDLGGAVIRNSRCPDFHRWHVLALAALRAGDRTLAAAAMSGTCAEVADDRFNELASLIENGRVEDASNLLSSLCE